MAQGRFLNKTISLSEKFALLPNDTTRLIATWCIPHLDKNGVTYGDARKVRALVVPMLELTTAQVNEAITAMNDFGLIRLFNVNGEMWMHWPGFADNQTMSALARERTSFPEPPAELPTPPPPVEAPMQPHVNASDAQTLANDEQAFASNYMQPHVNASNSMLNIKESKLSESKLKEIDAAGKKNDQPKSEPAAAEPESIKLWREWTLHTGKIAPTFFERLTNEVKDIDVWADTLAFGAKNRKIAHTNTGLDWALTNYKTGVAQKRANALTKNQSGGNNVVGKYADKLVKTEIDGVEVYYG